MSPTGHIKGIKKKKDSFSFAYADKGFSPIEQPINGRITLSLDLAFERQWNDSQRGTLPSLSLDYIGETVLNKKKLVSEKFPDTNEFYRRAWLEDTKTYLDYALQDVKLIVEIDESNYCSEAILSLQRLLKAPFDACFYASHMGSIYFMRNAWWKCKTGSKVEKRETYEGAMIYDPLSEQTQGLHLNVAAFDFAGLYPSMMIARNISWETISEEPTEFAVNILTPRDFSPVEKKHMLYFKTDELGLLPRAVLELKELRNDYKKRMKTANDSGEYQKWYNNQMAVKRLMASFYGIIAFQGFGWANVNLAASITASAREAIRLAAFKAKELEV
jgi:DNA polymerase I